MRNKPKNMKYTDLCIYIDKTVYKRDEKNNPIGLREMDNTEIDNVYTYLYHILYALSVKKHLFTNISDYSDFCIEQAGRLYMRITSPDQDWSYYTTAHSDTPNILAEVHELDDEEPTTKSRGVKPPVKSILNYIKSCLAFTAIDWRNANYAQVINPVYDAEAAAMARADLREKVERDYQSTNISEILDVFEHIGKYIANQAARSIYRKNKLNMHCLIISEYINLCQALTLSEVYEGASPRKKLSRLQEQLKNLFPGIQSWDPQRIPEPYIALQLRKSLKEMQDDIECVKRANTLEDSVIDDIIASALPTYGIDHSEGN